MAPLTQWGHKLSKTSKHMQKPCISWAERLQATRVVFGEHDAARHPDANARSHETADSCPISALFKFLLRFMTPLIQWGLKPSKNSNYLENHAFRGQIAVPRFTSFMYV